MGAGFAVGVLVDVWGFVLLVEVLVEGDVVGVVVGVGVLVAALKFSWGNALEVMVDDDVGDDVVVDDGVVGWAANFWLAWSTVVDELLSEVLEELLAGNIVELGIEASMETELELTLESRIGVPDADVVTLRLAILIEPELDDEALDAAGSLELELVLEREAEGNVGLEAEDMMLELGPDDGLALEDEIVDERLPDEGSELENLPALELGLRLESEVELALKPEDATVEERLPDEELEDLLVLELGLTVDGELEVDIELELEGFVLEGVMELDFDTELRLEDEVVEG